MNNSEDHSWHTSNSQLNLIVDLIYNSFIAWGKRQDELEQKFERLYKEYKKLEEQLSFVSNNITLVLNILEESKKEQIKINQNSDYIKEKIFVGKDKPSEDLEIVKKLVEEVKNLVLS